MTLDELRKMFTFTPLAGPDMETVGAIRAAGLEFAEEIFKKAPDSASRGAAIQHVLEAVMLTNVSIANSKKA
jgi:hypothetical protein